MAHYYIGGDLGTSDLKLLLVDDQGEGIAQATKEYPAIHPSTEQSEQDPLDWRKALLEGLDELVPLDKRQDVRGIALDGQMHGLVCLDDRDNPLGNAILWNDNRSIAEVDYLNNAVGKEILLKETGNIAYPGFTLPKLLWVKRNEPAKYKKIAHVLLPKDYLNFVLTGNYISEPSDACGTLYYDPRHNKWSQKLIELTDLPLSAFPSVIPSGEIAGRIRKEIAKEFGFREDVFVLAGAGDNAAAALGVGAIDEGDANLSLGTSGTIFMPTNALLRHDKGAIHSFDSALGNHGLLSCMLSAASSLGWLNRHVFETDDFEGEQEKIKAEELGKNRLYFLPYLTGERSPIADPMAKGAFIGFTPETGRKEMTLAVLEGVAFAFKDSLEAVRSMGIEVKESFLTGGGAKSLLWAKILANVLGLKLKIVSSRMGPSYGMALLAMVKDGVYASFHEAKEKNLKVQNVILPDPELTALYAERYEAWSKLYPSLKPVYPAI